jgi:hypothetical protein
VISTAHRFIFIHAPKTGGNAVQLALEPLSDDRRTVNNRQDGQQRFGIEGPITPAKHATLADYAARLGSELDVYRIIVGVRDPLDRAVSFYFSPHQWNGETPIFQRGRFEKAMSHLPSIVGMLTVGGEFRAPDHILRFERLADDLAECGRSLGLGQIASLAHVNASAASTGLRAETLSGPWVRAMVAERFAEDYERFGYCPTPVIDRSPCV